MSGVVGWSAFVAHGGVGGVVVEVGLVVGILFIFGAMFLRERRATKRGEIDESHERDEKLFREGHDEDR